MGKSKFLLLLICVLVVSVFSVNIRPVESDAPKETFESLTYDGDVYAYDANYTTVHDASTSNDINVVSITLQIGQEKGATYFISRGFVYFDTTSIPDGASITSANLTISFVADYSEDDFKVVIRNGQPTYPSIPLQKSDYYHAHYSGNAGELDTNGVSLNVPYDINITQLSWINKTGKTKLALISSNDKDSIAPTQKESMFIATAENSNSTLRPKLTVEWSYSYVFKGLYDEASGNFVTTGVNVTAYYTNGSSPDTFEVNGTYTYAPTTKPLYFLFDLTDAREYWLSDSEDTATIYIFNASCTTYTISFLDLAGVLIDNPYVEAQRYINGSLMTIEKRRVDAEDKVSMNLVNGVKYTVSIKNGATYTYGDLLMTSTTSVQLTLKGIDFPKDVFLTTQYVQIYGAREFGNPNGNITITYNDTLTQTIQVDIYINYRNGTNAYNATETANSFSHTWTSALNNTDYAVEVDINHQRYGQYTWRQYFPREFSEAPWSLAFLGSLPFVTSIILPSLLILMVAGSFSQINAEVGAFMAVVVATVLAYLGWIDITAGALIFAFSLAVMMGLIYAKRRVVT